MAVDGVASWLVDDVILCTHPHFVWRKGQTVSSSRIVVTLPLPCPSPALPLQPLQIQSLQDHRPSRRLSLQRVQHRTRLLQRAPSEQDNDEASSTSTFLTTTTRKTPSLPHLDKPHPQHGMAFTRVSPCCDYTSGMPHCAIPTGDWCHFIKTRRPCTQVDSTIYILWTPPPPHPQTEDEFTVTRIDCNLQPFMKPFSVHK